MVGQTHPDIIVAIIIANEHLVFFKDHHSWFREIEIVHPSSINNEADWYITRCTLEADSPNQSHVVSCLVHNEFRSDRLRLNFIIIWMMHVNEVSGKIQTSNQNNSLLIAHRK